MLHNQITQYKKKRVTSHLPPNHSSTQILPSILIRLLERPVPSAWQLQASATTEMETRANFSSTPAVIQDITVGEYKTGGRVFTPHSGRISMRESQGRVSSSVPMTLYMRMGRRKRSGVRHTNGRSKLPPKSIPMTAPTQIQGHWS